MGEGGALVIRSEALRCLLSNAEARWSVIEITERAGMGTQFRSERLRINWMGVFMTYAEDAISRLTAWIRDYGDQKEPVFIADLNAVLTMAYQNFEAELSRAWKPIESAPKDGTEILAGNAAGEFCVVKWDDVTMNGRKGWLVAVVATDWNHYIEMYAPTHWMELPSPPESR